MRMCTGIKGAEARRGSDTLCVELLLYIDIMDYIRAWFIDSLIFLYCDPLICSDIRSNDSPRLQIGIDR